MWALVDCSNFYCSCERIFRPDLEDKPVAVLSNNDGCLISLTPETKALGYKMGGIYHLLAGRLKRDGVTCFSSNYTLYGDISRRVMETLETVAPEIDQYSIDEAFVPFDRVLAVKAEEIGRLLHDRVRRWVGVPVRVGLGPTRTLAKLANHWAKKKSRVYRLELGSRELEEILEDTTVEEVWGIGSRLEARLARLGIINARQLRDLEAASARKLLSVVGQRTVMELRGVQCILDAPPAPRRTLVSSRSFGRRVSRKEDLAQALAMHCAIAGEKLRSEELEAGALSVWVTSSRHGEEPYVCQSADINLIRPTNITGELIVASAEALEKCYRPGPGFMKGGIMLYELFDENRRQRTLLEAGDEAGPKRQRQLMAALDRINRRFGRDTLHFAAQGPDDAFWHMRRQKMSGNFTTKWRDLPRAKAGRTE